jgi:hypothetical protein
MDDRAQRPFTTKTQQKWPKPTLNMAGNQPSPRQNKLGRRLKATQRLIEISSIGLYEYARVSLRLVACGATLYGSVSLVQRLECLVAREQNARICPRLSASAACRSWALSAYMYYIPVPA